MKRTDLRKTMVLLSVTFIFFCLVGDCDLARADTADVEILYTSAYPSHQGEIEVRLKNPMIIAGFEFNITSSNHDIFNFHTDSIRVQLDTIPVDTCTWEPESLHYQYPECYKDSIAFTAVRFVKIDTVGSLISSRRFSVQVHGDVGDTSLPDCKHVQVLGMRRDSLITPWPNYRTLFKLGVDAFCIPDSTTDRTVYFYIAPGGNSYLSDTLGYVIPFRYHIGGLTVWWSVPGDANADSLVNLGDVTFMISYVFKNGPRPCIPEAADVNGDCFPNLGDVVHLISYLYKAGPPPLPGCWHGIKEE